MPNTDMLVLTQHQVIKKINLEIMEKQEFKSFVVEEKEGKFIGTIKTRNTEELPKGDLLIKVSYSSLNYKDALSATGNKGVTKKLPAHTRN